MQIEFVPMLQTERDLYEIPRGRLRFQRYLEQLTGGTQDMILPIALLNPMGKEHVAATLDALLALDAEAVAAEAVRVADRQLARISGSLRAGLVVADDVGGGWTQRQLTEAKQRFEGDAESKRGWAVALLWTSDPPARERVRTEVLAAIYRARYLLAHGRPRTLQQMLAQEGLAARFAGLRPELDRAELAAVRAVIEPHRDLTHYPTLFACLYGDAAATAVGYPVLGLPARAGFALALDEAWQRRTAPEDALLGSPASVRPG